VLGEIFGAYIGFFILYVGYVLVRFLLLVRKEQPKEAENLGMLGLPLPNWWRINDYVQLKKHETLNNPKAVQLGNSINSGIALTALVWSLLPLVLVLLAMAVGLI
jgi:hypothetical protein